MNIELLRRNARGILGFQSPLYRLAARLLSFQQVLSREGLATLLQLSKIEISADREIVLNLKSLQYPIFVRPRTDDLSAVMNNVIREEYGQFNSGFSPKTTVDAGAYIGDTAAYFLTRFPHSRVFAIEPNIDSQQQAEKNLNPYGDRVTMIKKALWNEITTLKFGGEQLGAAISGTGREVATITIPSLMEEFGLETIDLLKMDIEGAEAIVLPSGIGSWMDKVGMILLETHGDDIEQAVLPLLRDFGFSCHRFRNVWYCSKF